MTDAGCFQLPWPRRRHPPLRTAFLIAALGFAGATSSRSAADLMDDPPASRAQVDLPIPIFLNTPSDFESFWKKLANPDFVILDGDHYRRLRQAIDSPALVKPSAGAIVDAVAISGKVEGNWARLTADFRVSTLSEGPTWVPIQLDGLTLSQVREGSLDRLARITEGRGWAVELSGRGEHRLSVNLIAPIRSILDRRRIELTLPSASSTSLDILLPSSVVEATTGPNEEARLTANLAESGVSLSARLSPRPRIEVAWRENADPSSSLPTMLSARGEISLEVERGLIRSRSSWVVESIRGVADSLTLRLDSSEELIDLEVDGKPVPVVNRRDSGDQVVTVPLTEPLRPPSRRALTLSTRRSIASKDSAKVNFRGFLFDQAKIQSGAIAVAKTGPIFLIPSSGRGIRRIDPRTELPESLRGRPETLLAFEFDDQPFELELQVAPAPPRLRVETKTTVTMASRTARVQARLDCRSSQGRCFEVAIGLPPGLEFDKAGPNEVVESARVVSSPDAKTDLSVEAGVVRTLVISLTPAAREMEEFSILLAGSCTFDQNGTVSIPVFVPPADSCEMGRIAIVSERNSSISLASLTEGKGSILVDWTVSSTEWPWPIRKPGPDAGLLWLRSSGPVEAVPLAVVIYPRAIHHESTLTASIDRRGTDVVDEIAGETSFGSLSRIDVSIPPEVPERWEVEGVELSRFDFLGRDPDGSRRYRLIFTREYSDAFRIRFRYRIPFKESSERIRSTTVAFNLIRALEGISKGRRVLIASDPGVVLTPVVSEGWGRIPPPELNPSSDSGPNVRLAYSSQSHLPLGSLSFRLESSPVASLPNVVVSRLWLQSVQRPDEVVATSVRFWLESRDGSLLLTLPPGARWVRARIGGSDLDASRIDLLPENTYRLRFPSDTPPGPIAAAFDFEVPTASCVAGWPAPPLFASGVIQQTLWEVRVSGTRAGVGTPSGWTDENLWYWAGGLWKRRPRLNPSELSNWLSGTGGRTTLEEPMNLVGSSGMQSYLFGRVGPPAELRFPIYSRIIVLLGCSGPLLACGLLVLARRPPRRLFSIGALILAFGAGSMIEANTLLLVLQSSTLGAILLLCSVVINWFIERKGRARLSIGPRSDEPVDLLTSSMTKSVPIGSDDSTAIRPRMPPPGAISTADHVFLVPPEKSGLERSSHLRSDDP